MIVVSLLGLEPMTLTYCLVWKFNPLHVYFIFIIEWLKCNKNNVNKHLKIYSFIFLTFLTKKSETS